MLLDPKEVNDFLTGYKALICDSFGSVPDDLESWVVGRDKMLQQIQQGDLSQGNEVSNEWKGRIDNVVSGKFIFLKRYKFYCAMQNMDSSLYYAVRSLTTPLEEMIAEFSIVETCLIPYKGMFVCDGLVVANNIHLGKNLVKDVRDGFWEARRSSSLIGA